MSNKDNLLREMKEVFSPIITEHALKRISNRLCSTRTPIIDSVIDNKIIRWPVPGHWIPWKFINDILYDMKNSLDSIYISSLKDWYIIIGELAIYILSNRHELLTVYPANMDSMRNVSTLEYEYIPLGQSYRLIVKWDIQSHELI